MLPGFLFQTAAATIHKTKGIQNTQKKMLASKKRVTIGEVTEQTPLRQKQSSSTLGGGESSAAYYSGENSSDDFVDGIEHFEDLKNDSIRRESLAADRLSVRLLEIDDDDSEAEERILRESLNLQVPLHGRRFSERPQMTEQTKKSALERLLSMIALLFLIVGLIAAALWVGVEFIGPPNQPAGPYELVERQVSNRSL